MKTLIIFAKAPIPGTVKTRLSASTDLSEAQVCQLYEAFLRDTIAVSTMSSAENIAIHFSPAKEEKMMKKIVRSMNLGARNDRRFTYTPQTGETFSERVAASFKSASGGDGDEIIMIGADAPILKAEIIDSAFEYIYARSGVTLGPTGGGGVYLIGHPAGAPIDYESVFNEGSELENLLEQAKGMNIPLKLLPEILDVDLESDLITLIGVCRAIEYQRQFDGGAFPSDTYKIIQNLGLKVVRASDDSRDKKIIVTAS